MSACMSGTRGSGVLSSTGDVLVRGVGGVCDMCMCLARGGVGGEGGEWMRELGLGFTNPLGTGGVLDMCLCFGCVGGVPYILGYKSHPRIRRTPDFELKKNPLAKPAYKTHVNRELPDFTRVGKYQPLILLIS